MHIGEFGEALLRPAHLPPAPSKGESEPMPEKS
jgi:hypothetical protein